MRRVRERGSICLYVAILLLSLGLLTAALVPLAGSLRARDARRVDELRARLAFEGGVALVRSHSLAQTLDLGVPLTVAFEGATATVTPVASSSPVSKGLLVTGVARRKGLSYRFSRSLGARQPAIFDFALFVKSSFEAKGLVTGASGEDGDAFTNGEFKVSSNGTRINGNAWAKDGFSLSGDTVITGRRYGNAAEIPWPSLDDSRYRTRAQTLAHFGRGSYWGSGTTLTEILFASPHNGEYACFYCGSSLSVKGTVSGRGTVFVNGDLTLSGDLRYADGDSRVAFVVKGNISVASAASTVEGFFFADGNLITQRALNVPRGAFAVANLSTDKALTIVRDNAVRDDTEEAARLRLPYYWP